MIRLTLICEQCKDCVITRDVPATYVSRADGTKLRAMARARGWVHARTTSHGPLRDMCKICAPIPTRRASEGRSS
jgi:hypothetical protein